MNSNKYLPGQCEVKGCSEPSEVFCYTANHRVCKEHHDLFHDGNWPKPEGALPRLKWKVKT